MIYCSILSVKTNYFQVEHIYPILYNATDRIYIKCTYQTPLSHLFRCIGHWACPNEPVHPSLYPPSLGKKWEYGCEEGAKKITLADIIPSLRAFRMICLCVTSIQHTFSLSSLWSSSLTSVTPCLPPLPVSWLVPYRCMFNKFWGTSLLFCRLCLTLPSSSLPRQ